MTPESILAKSPKGVEELETRAFKLGPRTRQALIRVDGAKTVGDLLGEAGDGAAALEVQLAELLAQGFVQDLTPPPAPDPAPAAPRTRPAPPEPPAAPPEPPAAPPEPALAPNSPLKFRLLDLLVDAMGADTSHLGAALERCGTRTELARWIDVAIAPITQRSGAKKAKIFEKAARSLVGG